MTDFPEPFGYQILASCHGLPWIKIPGPPIPREAVKGPSGMCPGDLFNGFDYQLFKTLPVLKRDSGTELGLIFGLLN
ncbi:MAG: hypothetical protein H6581_02465 [Bacteroidia bacterium]|nr:hypothetical protein [Bacteroidia bacterium]